MRDYFDLNYADVKESKNRHSKPRSGTCEWIVPVVDQPMAVSQRFSWTKSLIHFDYSDVRPQLEQTALEQEFHDLATKWKNETEGLSSFSSIVMNRNYQKIIGLGKPAVPFILRELMVQKRNWLWALEMIVKDEENPITPEIENSFAKSAQAWIEWGEKRKLI